ncbi:MAG: FeoA domain-containing protein [Deltaproteobacteria bacterium]|nr:FeoA domain-containing protein [Deltaproteobacteria bacterium]
MSASVPSTLRSDPSGPERAEATLAGARLSEPYVVLEVGGERGFRRRLMELGLVPGTVVRVAKVAPLGDPLELVARGSNLSIRAADAGAVRVRRVGPDDAGPH